MPDLVSVEFFSEALALRKDSRKQSVATDLTVPQVLTVQNSTELRAAATVVAALASVDISGNADGCERPWMASPDSLSRFGMAHSTRTDKFTKHRFQHMYHVVLSQMYREKCRGRTAEERTLRMLEIGLGCRMHHGPGGGVALMRALITPPVTLEMHVLEFDRECALQWAKGFPKQAVIHTGDQSSATDLRRVVDEAKRPFELIVDDGSHLNAHQIFSAKTLFPALALGGVYVVEDIHSACKKWRANQPYRVEHVDGTPGCMQTEKGEKTIVAHALEWVKSLAIMKTPEDMPDLVSVEFFSEALALRKDSRKQSVAPAAL